MKILHKIQLTSAVRPTGRGKGRFYPTVFQPVHVRAGVAMEPVPGRYNNGSGTQNLTFATATATVTAADTECWKSGIS